MSIGFDIDIKFHCFSIILFGVVHIMVLGWVGVGRWMGLWLRHKYFDSEVCGIKWVVNDHIGRKPVR